MDVFCVATAEKHKYLHVGANKFKIVIQDSSMVMWLNEIGWEFDKSFVHLKVWFINFVVRNRDGGCGLDMVLCAQFRQWQPWTEKTSAQLHKHFQVSCSSKTWCTLHGQTITWTCYMDKHGQTIKLQRWAADSLKQSNNCTASHSIFVKEKCFKFNMNYYNIE